MLRGLAALFRSSSSVHQGLSATLAARGATAAAMKSPAMAMLHSLARPLSRAEAGPSMRRMGPASASLFPASVSRQSVTEFRCQAFRHQSDTSRPPHSYRPKITSDFVVKAEERNKKGQRTAPARVRKTNQTVGVLAPEAAQSVSAYCIAEGFELKQLSYALRGENWAGVPERLESDVVLVPFQSASGGTGEIFLFDYGVVLFWGLETDEEEMVLQSQGIRAVTRNALPGPMQEHDEFECGYLDGLAAANTKGQCGTVQNGMITLDSRFLGNPLAKLAVSHAIAQSTKLSVFEMRVTRLAETTAHIPSALAATGEVKLSLKEASRLTGQLFLQKSAVNLLSTVLDVPEFFWDAADELQGLYGTVTKYLELKNRVAVLNARYEVLESMLLMVQQQLQNDHGSRLEWIIIWLIAVEIVLGLIEIFIMATGGH